MNYKKTALAASLAFSVLQVPAISFADDSANQPVEVKLVDQLTTLAHGPYKGFRANHAKGIMVEGEFTPAATAASLSKAPHLQSAPSPVLVRFSNATGVPTIPDTDPNALPKGMAIRFTTPEGSQTDIVVISVDRFPVATPEDFLGLLKAVGASGPDAPSPKPIETFLQTHPAAQKFVSLPAAPPVSFTSQSYFGINSFVFTNAEGKSQYGRYQIVPVEGNHFLTKEEAAKQSPNYLEDELPAQLSKQAVQFKIFVQLAEANDQVDDATYVFPKTNKTVELGTLTLKTAVENSKQAEKGIMFNPLLLPDGIAPSKDPILLARPGAYAVSFSRRAGQ